MFRPAPTPRISLFYRYKFGAFLTLLLLTNQKVNFIYQPFFKNSSPFFHIAKFRYILPKVSLDKPKSKFYLPFLEKLFSLLPARSPLFAANNLCASCTISKPFFLHRPPSCLYCVLTVCSFFPFVFRHKNLKARQCHFSPQSAFSTSFDTATRKECQSQSFLCDCRSLSTPHRERCRTGYISRKKHVATRRAQTDRARCTKQHVLLRSAQKKNAARNGRRSHKYVQDDLIDTSKNR